VSRAGCRPGSWLRRGHGGQHLPLRHLCAYPRRDQAGGSERMSMASNLSRRAFLRVGAAAGGGLLLSLSLPRPVRGVIVTRPAADGFAPNAFIRIDREGRLTLIMHKVDMGGTLPVPGRVALKDPTDFKLIGTPAKRLDTPAKVDGSARFGIDVKIPGMKVATVAACPVFGGKLASVDDTKAKLIDGVRQ